PTGRRPPRCPPEMGDVAGTGGRATRSAACRRVPQEDGSKAPGRPKGPGRASLPGVRIGVLGATGPAGGAIAVQLAAIGIDVVIGSRAKERAADTVKTLTERWPDRRLPLHPDDNDGAAGADLVVVATPWDGVLTTVAALEDRLAGKIVISMA